MLRQIIDEKVLHRKVCQGFIYLKYTLLHLWLTFLTFTVSWIIRFMVENLLIYG